MFRDVSFAFVVLIALLVVPDFRYAIINFLRSLDALILIALLLISVKLA